MRSVFSTGRRVLFALTACLALFVGGGALQAQPTGGKVLDAKGEPIIGASVVVPGTTNGVITDINGNFSIRAASGTVLEISCIGYVTQRVTAGPNLTVVLADDSLLLEEAVAVGYGSITKRSVSTAISTVKGDKIADMPNSTMAQSLAGMSAGITLQQVNGEPGSAPAIRIRGNGSINSGNDPLYVVDGVITTDISFLSPNDIQAMEILKDASATAIYGSRGANGVILITTKTGGTGKANISFDAYWGIQNRWRKLDLMGAQEMAETKLAIDAMKNGASQIGDYYADGFNEWMRVYNTGSSIYYPVIKTAANPNGFDYSSVDTDWQDEVFRKNAFMHNYNLSIDGGNDKGHYSFSASYFDQNGTLKGSDYKRLTLRFNSDYEVRSWLKIGEHLSFMTNSSHNDASNNNANAGVLSQSLRMAPWDPTHYPEGSVNKNGDDMSGRIAASSNFKNVYNPFSIIEMAHPNNTADRWVGDIWLEIEPIKHRELELREHKL